MSKSVISVVDLMRLIPSDMLEMLTAAWQVYHDQCWGVQNFDLVFRYDDRLDIDVNLNHYEDSENDHVEKVMDNASYTLHLIRQIEKNSPVLLPFVSNLCTDYGCRIDQDELVTVPDLTKAQIENKVWEIRKALSVEDNGWELKATERCIEIYITGEPKEDRQIHICIPYICPPSHYLSILKNRNLWEELIRSWAWPEEGAIALIEHNPKELDNHIHKYHGYRFVDKPVPTPTDMSLEDFREKGYMTLEEFIERVSKLI